MLNRTGKKTIPILMYHSISQHASPKYRPFAVPPELFADQMAYLRENGYTSITVTQFINARVKEKEVLPERPVVITFDDGLEDFFTDALPILQRYGLVATLYVTTGFVNGMSRWLQPEGEGTRRMLTWDQLTEISVQGIECGGHSHSHPQLDTLPQSVARDEIVRCKQLLEDHLGQEILSFAYPHGYHSTTTKRLVREAGYTSACAVKYEMCSQASDSFALARLIVTADTGREAFASLLTSRVPSVGAAIYRQARVPLWRLTRRCSLSIHQHLPREVETC